MLNSKLELNDDQRKAIFLGYLEQGLTQRQIAEKMNCTEANISKHFKRLGMQKKKKIDDEIKDNLIQVKSSIQVQNKDRKIEIKGEEEDYKKLTDELLLTELYRVITDQTTETSNRLKAIQISIQIKDKKKTLVVKGDIDDDVFDFKQFGDADIVS
jgi:transcriptional regulator